MTLRRTPRWLRASFAVLCLAGVLVAAPATAEPVPQGYTYSHGWFTSHDGTQLHAGVFLPADRKPKEKHPVLLTSTPYTAPNGGATGANMTGPTIRFPELFEHDAWRKGRWAYVQVDVRGFGGSGGCFEYYMPNEAKDVKVAVEWAAKQSWSTGKVGMWGKSYDAAQQVLALASKPKGLAGTVIQAPGLSAYTALWMNGVHYGTGRYGTTGVYTADDAAPPQNQDTLTSPEYAAATAAVATSATSNPTCRSDALVRMNTEADRKSEFWKTKEPYRGAAGSTVPVLWSHGFFDANTKPVHTDIWTSLRGPKQAWFGQYTHLRGHEPGVGREGFLDESIRFLDRYVRGVKVSKRDPVVTVQEGNGDGRWRTEAAWPPADARAWTMPIRAGSYVDRPGNTADGSTAGQGHWTVTRPLPHTAHLAGEAEVAAKVTTLAPYAQVIAHLYDIDADGNATMVQRGAFATGQTGAVKATFKLYPQDWVFQKGHRIGIHLSAADGDWYRPGASQTTVTVTGGTFTLPLLGFVRDTYVAGDISDGMTQTPFAVGEDTLEEATVDSPPPPKQRRRR
ncbi:MAG TPA: CocE/NonD family hydrolase [Mycobacteriales bacterium]|nr:CocE/NonD family hydrolase [Mycobacteriales bacterium]